jgi:hypothetical protein
MGAAPRSERTVIYITANAREDLAKIAVVHRTSVNDVINEAVAAHLLKYGNDIQRYNDFFGEK